MESVSRALFPEKFGLIPVIVASLVLSSCMATTGSTLLSDSGSNTYIGADPRLTEGEQAQFFSKSGLTACAGGAGVGALACLLSKTKKKAECMMIAAVAGCGVAMGANYYYDYRRSQYSNTAVRLQAMTNDIRVDTERVAMRTNTLRQVISDDTQRISDLQRFIKNKQIDIDKTRREIASIDSNIAQMRKEVGNMRNKVTEYEKTAQLERKNGAGNQVAKVEADIAQLNKQVNSLQQEVDDLYSLRSAITLG